MHNILIIEDDISLNQGLSIYLSKENNTFQAHELKTAEDIFKNNKIDLIILDISLPDGSGLEFCSKIRAASNVPIIFLTANNLETDVVSGFIVGCDDFVTKPFSMMILQERIKAVLKRCDGNSSMRFTIDDLVLDFDNLIFSKGEKTIELSKNEQKLLKKLILNKGQILTREQLMETIYSNDSDFIVENALNVTIRRLRQKIEDDPKSPVYIKNIYGLGYIWTGGIAK
ncbi:MAG: response regulator transcription factor [Ruminococcus sp.]|nr:response regulator transcription factor [Ruminococcus sp.]MBR6394594.1 response regulator transcription factor [Ruminococcus sp.]